jgi:hypothetical protein
VEFVTGTPTLAFASEAVPNSRSDPRAIVGQFTDQNGLYCLNARYYDTGIRTEPALHGTLRHDTFMTLRGTTRHGLG